MACGRSQIFEPPRSYLFGRLLCAWISFQTDIMNGTYCGLLRLKTKSHAQNWLSRRSRREHYPKFVYRLSYYSQAIWIPSRPEILPCKYLKNSYLQQADGSTSETVERSANVCDKIAPRLQVVVNSGEQAPAAPHIRYLLYRSLGEQNSARMNICRRKSQLPHRTTHLWRRLLAGYIEAKPVCNSHNS